MSRPLIPIDASWERRVLEKDKDYLYRGYVIRVEDDGYGVYDPQRPDDMDEDGWGISVYDAMVVINEIVDGCERRK